MRRNPNPRTPAKVDGPRSAGAALRERAELPLQVLLVIGLFVVLGLLVGAAAYGFSAVLF